MRPSLNNPIVIVFCAGWLAFATSACALTSKASLVEIRFFSPERLKPPANGQAPVAAADPAESPASFDVRLGRVTSGPNLRDRIGYRNAAYEQGYYEDLRWTERPESYVRRQLGRSLFETHGHHRMLGGEAPTLDVELIAFDELRLPSTRAVQVQLKVILYEDNAVIYEQTLTIDRPVAGDKPEIEDIVAAMATALDAATEQITLKVQGALKA